LCPCWIRLFATGVVFYAYTKRDQKINGFVTDASPFITLLFVNYGSRYSI
jgi:hypothetical protein